MIEFAAIAIPLQLADQQKLEGLLRKIPSSVTREEVVKDKKIRSYSFPELNGFHRVSRKNDFKQFKILCRATFYLHSSIPSHSSCELFLYKNADYSFDEYLVEIKDPYIVKSLYSAMSYGDNVKRVYSLERPYGLNINGDYKKHFRYSFTCSMEKCQLTMSTAGTL